MAELANFANWRFDRGQRYRIYFQTQNIDGYFIDSTTTSIRREMKIAHYYFYTQPHDFLEHNDPRIDYEYLLILCNYEASQVVPPYIMSRHINDELLTEKPKSISNMNLNQNTGLNPEQYRALHGHAPVDKDKVRHRERQLQEATTYIARLNFLRMRPSVVSTYIPPALTIFDIHAMIQRGEELPSVPLEDWS